jgi:hypothetical protein
MHQTRGRVYDLDSWILSWRMRTSAGHDISRSALGGTSLLLSHEQLSGPLDSTVKRQSTEITTLLGSSTMLRSSSVDLGWKNFAIERHTILAGEKPEAKLHHHCLILWDVRVAEGESAYHSGQFSPYKKYRNTITACLPGIRPAARSRFDHEVIVGALHPEFILGIRYGH